MRRSVSERLLQRAETRGIVLKPPLGEAAGVPSSTTSVAPIAVP